MEASLPFRIMVRGALVLDTPIVLVLVVGAVDPALLGSIQHLRAYNPDDYPLVLRIASSYTLIAVTPHVLTEVAYFITKVRGSTGAELRLKFGELVQAFRERKPPTRRLARRAEFRWLDVADCSLLDAAGRNDVLFTGDAKLMDQQLRLGGQAINLNHLRDRAWADPGL